MHGLTCTRARNLCRPVRVPLYSHVGACQEQLSKSISIVREALETSVTWTPPEGLTAVAIGTSEVGIGMTCTGTGFIIPEVETELSAELNWAQIREVRNSLLSESDWKILPGSPLSDEEKTEWHTYRQALRDLPANTSNPADPTYPTPPTS